MLMTKTCWTSFVSDVLNDRCCDVRDVVIGQVEMSSYRCVFAVSDVAAVLEETGGKSVTGLANVLEVAE